MARKNKLIKMFHTSMSSVTFTMRLIWASNNQLTHEAFLKKLIYYLLFPSSEYSSNIKIASNMKKNKHHTSMTVF